MEYIQSGGLLPIIILTEKDYYISSQNGNSKPKGTFKNQTLFSPLKDP